MKGVGARESEVQGKREQTQKEGESGGSREEKE